MSTDITKANKSVKTYSMNNGHEMLDLAAEIKRFVTEQKLFSNIQGREYVNVEGWQFAGAQLGIIPIVTSTTNHSSDTEIKYSASCELINVQTGQKVGAGIATCSNKEQGKKYFAEYAIESMAQTRCVGKAFRLMLAWTMRAAGFEPTPAEEMDAIVVEEVKPKPDPAKQLLDELLKVMDCHVFTNVERETAKAKHSASTAEKLGSVIEATVKIKHKRIDEEMAKMPPADTKPIF